MLNWINSFGIRNSLDSPLLLLVNQLTPSINSKDQIWSLAKQHGPDLQAAFVEEKAAFLFALSGKETTHGIENIPRYEPAFGPGGLYYQKSKLLKELYRKFGALASCSWGPWQILAITAIENQHFSGHPAELHNGFISLPYAVGYLNYLIKNGANTLERLFASYNAGLGCLKNGKLWPTKYVQDALLFYDSALKIKF